MRRPRVVLAGSILLSAAFLLAAAKPAPRKPAPQKKTRASKAVTSFGNADAITQDELKDYDYFLASDQLEGRNLPSRGYDTAALYVASHLNEWGLQPGGSTQGTNGPLQPYFMPFDLVSTNPNPADMKLSINIPKPAHTGRRGRGGFGGSGRGAQLTPGSHDIAYGHGWMVEAARGRNAPP